LCSSTNTTFQPRSSAYFLELANWSGMLRPTAESGSQPSLCRETQDPYHPSREGVRRRDHHGLRRRLPYYPSKRYEDWTLDDPAGQGIDVVRPIRDQIRGGVEQLIHELLGEGARATHS
jgi:hypothetical protein